MEHPAGGTPLRALDLDTRHGCRLLSAPPDDEWLDGSEALVLGRVLDAADLSSWSDELDATARTWPELYHLSTARANVVRGLDLHDRMRVLEIGAGCGAVTRWLGETAAVVDAVEPTPARARTLRARMRGLDGVEVFVGRLEDVPAQPAYDAVVVIGVLEYVGGGTAAPGPYVDFLRRVREVLVPGGTLVLAIENRLGAKYLAGAPEDHTSRVFDSVEGYPHGSPARTFSRRELTTLLREADLDPTFLQAFPDYKLPRAVFSDALVERSAALTAALPPLPSPDWTDPRPDLLDEEALWRTLVDAGLAGETGNSFVVLARSGDGPAAPLWPATRLAAYWSDSDRRSRYVLSAEVVDDGGVLSVRRRHATGAPPPEENGLSQRAADEPVVHGTPFTAAWSAEDASGRRRLVARWRALLDQTAQHEAAVPVDLVPRNLVVTGDGELTAFDQEWWSATLTVDDVLQRGVLELARARLTADRSGSLVGRTLREICEEVADEAGVLDRCPFDDDWVGHEAALQAQVLRDRHGRSREEHAAQLADLLRRQLDAPAPGPEARLRLHERAPGLQQEVLELRQHLDAAAQGWAEAADTARQAIARAERAERALAEVAAERDRLASSVAYRLGVRATGPLRAALPAGSARRAAALRVVRPARRRAAPGERS